uniref:Uncharacterized protein n=1 Tax=Klebsiella pneumoniae TaxID=573 RepID=A0A7D5G590_KLEPN|nr:hypothetical protein [Klebsiella pneumoniae]
MPRKRLEGRSLKGRGTGAHSQRRRAGAEKPPVPYQTGRDEQAACGRLALTPGERGITGIPVHKSGLKIVDNLKANDGEARENRRHHVCSFFEQPESLYQRFRDLSPARDRPI